MTTEERARQIAQCLLETDRLQCPRPGVVELEIAPTLAGLEQAVRRGLEQVQAEERAACARFLDAADKSKHPADLADALRAGEHLKPAAGQQEQSMTPETITPESALRARLENTEDDARRYSEEMRGRGEPDDADEGFHITLTRQEVRRLLARLEEVRAEERAACLAAVTGSRTLEDAAQAIRDRG